MSLIQGPPPWLWCAEGRLCQRPGIASARRLPLEVLQQLHWWLIRPWRVRLLSIERRRRGLAAAIPWTLTLRACWLNSYRPAELAWWWSLGVRSWAELGQHLPESLVPALHAARRHHWPEHCRPALQRLADKAALLEATPGLWQAPFLRLRSADGESGSGGGPDGQERIPAWWGTALAREGVVIKPQRGHAGRAVIRFRWTGSSLEQEALFRHLPDDAPRAATRELPAPSQLLAHWQRLSRTQEPALAAPYLSHSAELPATDPSVVVRVVTARPAPQASIGVREAWLEVPLGDGAVAFIGTDGVALPCIGEPLTAEQRRTLEGWTRRLAAGLPPAVGACVQAAIALHARLPPIDQVAWDWIPADPEPLLLEGNGGFGLLVLQLLARARAAAVSP